MADQIKQLAFKDFSITELQAGTAANVLTTNASTHYVIKSIEATQGDNANAINATATLGLTAGLGTGQFTSLGTVAQKDRIGLSGSAIMDASSTLTIRPTAKTINFIDEKVASGKTSTAVVNEHFVKSVHVNVNGLSEPTLKTETTVNKTTGTYSGSYDTMTGSVPSGNYKVHHTNANGVNLIIVFGNSGTSGARFAVWNADTNVQYGYYHQSYDRPIFDGQRYIFWASIDGGGMRIRWYDLDESTTNLAASNTLGGGNNADFYHGQTGAFAGSTGGIASRTTYDNHLNAYFQNRHTNNKRYFCGYSNGNNRGWLVEFAETLTNDNNNAVPKWVYLTSATNKQSGSTDPFGNNSSAWNMTALINSQQQPTSEAQMLLTYDSAISRYMIWYSKDNNNWWPMTFTQAELDGTNNAEQLSNDGAGDTHGIRVVSNLSAADINVDSSAATNGSSNNMKVEFGADNGYVSTTTGAYAGNGASTMSPAYVDGSNWYFRNIKPSSDSAYKVVKVDLSNVTTAVNLIPNTTIPSNVWPSNIFVGFAIPSSTTIASRAYTKAPTLKVRVTGILSDQ